MQWGYFFVGASALLTTARAAAVLAPRQQIGVYPAPGGNNFSCTSASHPNPVVFLHGLLANKDEDLNVLQTHMQSIGFCTYSLTYGDHPLLPFVGGVQAIKDSAPNIGAFIKQVQSKTGAAKVDIVGHSEGAFQSLYTPKFVPGVSGIVDKIVSIAPPTNGTDFAGLYDLAYLAGLITRDTVGLLLDVIGCPACNDLGPGGAAVLALNDGKPIKQPGNSITVIISRHDELVTPVKTSQVNEAGVRNVYVQDTCPSDKVGHIGEAYDTYIWSLVINTLDPTIPLGPCVQGMAY